ncbi:hypothetical protein ACFL0M_16040, partial [Thermodesulfobacteriota bacterium]
PRVLLLTTDSKVIKCRKQYPFIISTTQFVEFMLPYLFISEIPAEQPNKFPNKILSAQLGINISFWKPSTEDVVSMFLSKPELLKQTHWYGDDVPDVAKTLNKERFNNVVKESSQLTPEEKDELVKSLSPVIEKTIDAEIDISFTKKEINYLRKELLNTKESERDMKEKNKRLQSALAKYKRTVKYLKKIRSER